jgi:hypothetical protein
MADKVLARTVTVQKYKGEGAARRPVGEPRTFNKGETPPAEWAELITNPSAWEPARRADGPVSTAATDAPPAPEAPATRAPRKRAAKATDKAAAAAKDEADVKPDGGSAATGGAGDVTPPADEADADAWRAYAEQVGVTPPEDADADSIKADLADRGLLEQQ